MLYLYPLCTPAMEFLFLLCSMTVVWIKSSASQEGHFAVSSPANPGSKTENRPGPSLTPDGVAASFHHPLWLMLMIYITWWSLWCNHSRWTHRSRPQEMILTRIDSLWSIGTTQMFFICASVLTKISMLCHKVTHTRFVSGILLPHNDTTVFRKTLSAKTNALRGRPTL